ncbi:NfeD family protein [Methylobacterium iners]|uniref:Inner membrane protein YbbJ n=1 Tax=Methylobacterium iners TaxID=418707 RepID=A0ABQ4RSU0_9HYPH|nr:NfeD family protein [Methylobacterium iners]GJD93851.1 Inner membrane protein YbbJ [Methylobacterium iners]
MTGTLLGGIGPTWAWIILGLVLMGLELVASGIFLLWLGLAAVLTGLVVAVVAMSWPLQILLFSGLAVALVLVASRRARSPDATVNRGARGLIGREFVLDEPIVAGAGRLRFDDTIWRVAGPDAPAGRRVRVTGVEGTVLRVEMVT